MSTYLPKCCRCWRDNGRYVVDHDEHSPACRHTPSGGTGGSPDGRTRCNRIIGSGATRREAISEARYSLGLPTE